MQKSSASTVKAVALPLENQIAGVPAGQEDMTPVCIVTEKTLLRSYYTPQQCKDKRIQDFMAQPVVHFGEDAKT